MCTVSWSSCLCTYPISVTARRIVAITVSLGRINASTASVESTRRRLHLVRGWMTACPSSCRLVGIAVLTTFLLGAQPQVAVLKEREGQFAEPVLISNYLCQFISDRLCAPLEGAFL